MKRHLLALVLLFAVSGSVSVQAQSKEASDSAVIAQLKAISTISSNVLYT